MKIVINACFGGFSLSDEACADLGVDPYDFDRDRTNPVLIEYVEKHPDTVSGDCAHLFVEEIPDEATDYFISEYDGNETLVYVLDGKIRLA